MFEDSKILKEILFGFIRIHIMYHTSKRAFYGQELKNELEEHGYSISYGSLYPLLSKMEEEGYLQKNEVNNGGKIRKYYSTTEKGNSLYSEVLDKLRELNREVLT
jgi:PadR family transcriptional regulator, regulatory protein PadR